MIVAVSSDRFNWEEKQKKCEIPDKDRMAIVEAIKYVDKVIPEDSWEQKIEDVKIQCGWYLCMGDGLERKISERS